MNLRTLALLALALVACAETPPPAASTAAPEPEPRQVRTGITIEQAATLMIGHQRVRTPYAPPPYHQLVEWTVGEGVLSAVFISRDVLGLSYTLGPKFAAVYLEVASYDPGTKRLTVRLGDERTHAGADRARVEIGSPVWELVALKAGDGQRARPPRPATPDAPSERRLSLGQGALQWEVTEDGQRIARMTYVVPNDDADPDGADDPDDAGGATRVAFELPVVAYDPGRRELTLRLR